MNSLDTARLNGLIVDRVTDPNGITELRLCPVALESKRVPHRPHVGGRPECRHGNRNAVTFDSIVQVKLAEDDGSGGFVAGTTMRDGGTVQGLRKSADKAAGTEGCIVTVLENASGSLRLKHQLESTTVDGTLLSRTEITNTGTHPVTLENFSSFVLAGMTAFAADDAPRRLRVHRFRSWWSNEGRHQCQFLEELNLERDWEGCKTATERFGQVGTMPVRKFFPFVAIEDVEAGVFWGAQLAWSGSWQMEITRRGDCVSISGGLADFEFGHWRKTLQPRETFTTPTAHLACVAGSLADLTHKFVQLQESLLASLPEAEKDLPIIFNEWCTNWGSPSHDKTLALARRLQGCGVKYLVIDDGWAVRPAAATMQSNGDWIVDRDKFPHGMKPLCDELRRMGFIPGIWFEFEVCNPGSKAWSEDTHHLQRDGRPLRIGSRRFWNLNDPWVIAYLDQKLIGFLKENGFGYLKVDYNDTIGLGCDHTESVGEGLRRQVTGIHGSFKRLREQIPDLVIENCSSGGHRLEPAMMALTSMSSFSDAHESLNLPIIARQLHHLVPPRQSQIWAVLYSDDTPERFVFSLTATFYGRMCLSGPVHDLNDAQMVVVRRATDLYAKVAPIIREGRTTFLGETPFNWNNPTGWQGIWRENFAGDQALLVVHLFEEPTRAPLEIKILGAHSWRIASVLTDETTAAPFLSEGTIHLPRGNVFRGYALFLHRLN
ncbi:MAG TPA: alpha-galactosidase [Rariglobus sp.]|nr:alpha-galactosidase [Rariglobus sp.]